jgi:hypothetical protein
MSDYVQSFLLGVIFGLLVVCYVEVKRIEKKLRKILKEEEEAGNKEVEFRGENDGKAC